MKTAIDIIMPLVTAIGGYFFKMFVDYRWLKSPRISFSQKIVFDRHIPIYHTSKSEFSYTVFLQISNNSANEAYDFKITGIDAPAKMNFKFRQRLPTIPTTINAGGQHLIRVSFVFEDETENFFSYNRSRQMFMSHFSTSTYVINYEFRSSMGKIYKKSRQYGFINDFEENII